MPRQQISPNKINIATFVYEDNLNPTNLRLDFIICLR